MAAPSKARVVAVLGPTNTGKTHLALERMLGFESGIIGLPLRLLAREVYDKIARARGARSVALVTGEEKIVPQDPRWFVCTTEAMPVERAVDFVAIDEVQLAADDERGHVFTDRILNARGRHETLLLGSDTIKPLVRRLVPEAEFVGRPRFSSLTHAGHRKLNRLPRRSAVVAFSADEVYRMAEALRGQRGGAAVVLGALSPRARNAQVALFQAGEVDYLVATDAIGMGLNMDVDHVAFAGLRKFDGNRPRALEVAEIAQIAGRAGRYLNDGTFGTTAEVEAFTDETVAMIEAHEFPRLKSLRWRNSRLSFGSVQALLADLEAPPPAPFLIRQGRAIDHQALAILAQDPAIARQAADPEGVRLLWDVCQIPDFRKVLAETHVRLLARVFSHLRGDDGRLPADWVARSIAELDRVEGDIDTLMARIAHVRTWTYMAHRAGWLNDAAHWQERTRAIEDRLSDALHRGLTQRFVDQRTTALVRRLGADEVVPSIGEDGLVEVDGEPLGRLDGLRFAPVAAATRREGRAVWAVARRALKDEVARRLAAIASAGPEAFGAEPGGAVLFGGARIAKLVPGPDPLRPRVELLAGDLVEPREVDGALRTLDAWAERWSAAHLGALHALRRAKLDGLARGLAFALIEALGTVPVGAVQAQVKGLGEADRALLGRLGVRFGQHHVYVQGALKSRAIAARSLVFALSHGGRALPSAPIDGERWIAVDADAPPAFYAAIGFIVCGGRALRVDLHEAAARELRRAVREGGTSRESLIPPRLVELTGTDLGAFLAGLDYRLVPADETAAARAVPARRGRGRAQRARPSADSPFAKLKDLDLAR